MAPSNDWTNATTAVDELLTTNRSFLNSVNDMKSSGFSKPDIVSALKEEPKERGNVIVEPEFLRTTARTLQPKDINIDVLQFAHQKGGLAHDFDRLVAQGAFMDSKREFSDIVIDGPANAKESTLLEAATNFLEPAQFKDAVASGKTTSQVASMVDASQAKNITRVLMQEIAADKRTESQERDAQKQQRQQQKKPERSYGVMSEIQKNLKEATLGDLKPESTPAVDKDKSRGRGGPE